MYLQNINIPLTILIIVTIFTVYYSLMYSITLILSFINNDDINIINDFMLIITIVYHYLINMYLWALFDSYIGQILNIIIFVFLLYYTLYSYYIENVKETVEELDYIWEYEYEQFYFQSISILFIILLELTLLEYFISFDLNYFLYPLFIIFNIHTYLYLKWSTIDLLFAIKPNSIPRDIDINLIIVLIYQYSISFLFLLYNLKGDISEINIFLNGYEYILTSVIVLIRPSTNFSIRKMGIRFISKKSTTKILEKVTSKATKIKTAIKPSSTKDFILLSLNSLKTSITYFIKAFTKFQVWMMKNPFVAPFYIVFKKIILPLTITFYILKKLRWLRFFIYVSSLILSVNFDLLNINWENIIGIVILIYDFVLLKILNAKVFTFDFFNKIYNFIFRKASESKQSIKESVDRHMSNRNSNNENVTLKDSNNIKNDNLGENKFGKIHRDNLEKERKRIEELQKMLPKYDPTNEERYLNFWKILTLISILSIMGLLVYLKWDEIHGWVIAIPSLFSSGRDVIVHSYQGLRELISFLREFWNGGDGPDNGGGNEGERYRASRFWRRYVGNNNNNTQYPIPNAAIPLVNDNSTPEIEIEDLSSSSETIKPDSSHKPEENRPEEKNTEEASDESTNSENNSSIKINLSDSDENNSNPENEIDPQDKKTWNKPYVIPTIELDETIKYLKHYLNISEILPQLKVVSDIKDGEFKFIAIDKFENEIKENKFDVIINNFYEFKKNRSELNNLELNNNLDKYLLYSYYMIQGLIESKVDRRYIYSQLKILDSLHYRLYSGDINPTIDKIIKDLLD